MSIISAVKYGLAEAAYQFYRNVKDNIEATKKQVQVYSTFVTTNPLQMLIDAGVVIKPMRREQAMKILNVVGAKIDKAQLERNYKKYREQNVLSPFLQAKIDVAYSVLK